MKLTGINFWSNGKEAAFIGTNGEIIEKFNQAFINTNWHPDIVLAMSRYEFDLHRDHILCNDDLYDAIMRLNILYRENGLPISCQSKDLDIWVQNQLTKLDKYLSE